MALVELQKKSFGENRPHVAEAHGELRERKNRASFENKIPCKLRDIIYNPPDLPRENSVIFVMKINSFARMKTSFLNKTLKKAGAVFPRRDV